MVLQCGDGAWLQELAIGDQRQPTRSDRALEVCYTYNPLYKSTFTLLNFFSTEWKTLIVLELVQLL